LVQIRQKLWPFIIIVIIITIINTTVFMVLSSLPKSLREFSSTVVRVHSPCPRLSIS